MASILYIGQNPTDGTGSPIIIQRHLRRFAADGWEVRLVAEFGGNYAACFAAGWRLINLPLRRVWWPPFRDHNPFLRKIRLVLLAQEIRKSQVNPPDVIFSYLASHTEFSSDLAAHYTRLSRRPLHVLVHDDATAFPRAKHCSAALRRRQNAALAPASTAWFVSPELAETYESVSASRKRVILPIPEGDGQPAEWNSTRAFLKIYYAGHIWPEQVPLLERCASAIANAGGKLIVLANQCLALREAAARTPLEIMPHFASNTEALDHLRMNASAVIVSYADDTSSMPWSTTSFPSKLIEFAHLGLPIALVAPLETAAQSWARKTMFKPTFLPLEMEALKMWVSGLSVAARWNEASAAVLQLARDHGNPTVLHGELDAAFRSHLLTNEK
jgi:Glycosyl transferase 4-like domain